MVNKKNTTDVAEYVDQAATRNVPPRYFSFMGHPW